MTDRLEEELEVARRAALAAGAIVLRHYGAEGGIEVHLKAPGDPVTAADRESNDAIVASLASAFPGDAILAEETGAGGGAGDGGRRWCVDPLDGTKEFIARNGEFAVMIGLAVRGRPVLGVVYQAAAGILLEGVVGAGAWITEGGSRRPARVTATADPAAMRLVVSRSHRSALVDAVKRKLALETERPSGSVGIKIGLLVRQEADVYVHPGRGAKLWDACAPEAILVAAGGRMTDSLGQPIRYDTEDVSLDRGLVASNGAAHDRIVAAVGEAIRERQGGGPG